MGTRKPRGYVVRGTEKNATIQTGSTTSRLPRAMSTARKRLQSNSVKFRESIVPRAALRSSFSTIPMASVWS
jgi:hypothetical protein